MSRSTTESKYQSAVSLTDEITWIRFLLSELKIAVIHTPILWCDNLSTIDMSTDSIIHACTKHIELDYLIHERESTERRN